MYEDQVNGKEITEQLPLFPKDALNKAFDGIEGRWLELPYRFDRPVAHPMRSFAKGVPQCRDLSVLDAWLLGLLKG